jgi:hypothetical protein
MVVTPAAAGPSRSSPVAASGPEHPVEDAALGEVDLVRLGPAAEHLIDGDEADVGEQRPVPRRHLRVADPVEVARDDVLALGGVEELEVGGRDLARAALVGHRVHERDREVGLDAERRGDHVELVSAVLAPDRVHLGLERDQHVADLALDEGRRGPAPAGVEHGHVG